MCETKECCVREMTVEEEIKALDISDEIKERIIRKWNRLVEKNHFAVASAIQYTMDEANMIFKKTSDPVVFHDELLSNFEEILNRVKGAGA